MSDMMLAVLQMPYELAMNGELAQRQYYSRANEAVELIAKLKADVENLRTEVSDLRAQLALMPFDEEHEK